MAYKNRDAAWLNKATSQRRRERRKQRKEEEEEKERRRRRIKGYSGSGYYGAIMRGWSGELRPFLDKKSRTLWLEVAPN